MEVSWTAPPALRVLAFTLLLPSCYPQAQVASAGAASPQRAMSSLARETLHYGVEWRLIRAGNVKLLFEPGRAGRAEAGVDLDSAGLVAKLYRVEDRYRVQLEDQFCAAGVLFTAIEGKRQRETRVSYDRGRGKVDYLERDLIKKESIARRIDVPQCVHDVVGGLFHLRTLHLEPGQSVQMPVSDGKKMAQVKVEAQEREEIKTPTGVYKTIRYEAWLFNDVLYNRKGHLQVWISDDARRLPVQIRARMQFLIGNITLGLEKIER